MSRALALAAVLLAAGHALAQRVTPDDRDKRWSATRTTVPPKIDGKLDDAAWMSVRSDARFNDVEISNDWDGLWLGATSRDGGGWSAEIMIPLKTLRYEGRRTEFGFQVRRSIQRRGEIDEWAHIPRSARGEVSYYGTLD